MKILIDGRTIKNNPSGVGVWNIRLIEYLLQKTDLEKVIVLLQKTCNYDFAQHAVFSKHLGTRLKTIEAEHAYKFVTLDRFLYEQLHLHSLIKKLNVDIYHATDSFGIPLFLEKKIKTILTVHDLIPLTPYRELMNSSQFLLYKLSLYSSINRANRFVAISEKTKQDMEHYLHLDGDEIRVINNGIDRPDNLDRNSQNKTWNALAQQHNLQRDKYVLYFGGFGTRRNIPMLVRAFKECLSTQAIPSNTKLVLSGRMSGAKGEHLANLTGLQKLVQQLNITKQVIFLDYVKHEEKYALINNARLFAMLSLYEGFGLNVNEVLLAGKPALFSRVGCWYSYPQKSQMIIENPLDIKEVTTKLANCFISSEDIERERTVLEAYINQFSWNKMGQLYYNLYEQTIKA